MRDVSRDALSQPKNERFEERTAVRERHPVESEPVEGASNVDQRVRPRLTGAVANEVLEERKPRGRWRRIDLARG